MARFVPVARLDDIPVGSGRPAFVDGRVVALFRIGDAVYALDDACPHAGSSLSAGKFEGAFVQCRAHGLRFDVRSGAMRGVDGYCARTHPVRVVDGEVSVGVECEVSATPGCPAAPDHHG